MDKNEAQRQSRAFYSQALDLAERLRSPEIEWRALQGLGNADKMDGKLEHALERYKKAIAIAASLYLSSEDMLLAGEYLTEREDLYSEAIELCNLLYNKSGNQAYLSDMLKYSETLRNEMQKAAAAAVKMQYQDPVKQELYQKLQNLGKARAKAMKAGAPAESGLAAADATKNAADGLTEEAARQREALDRLDREYNAALVRWNCDYREDAPVFDATDTRVDLKEIQKHLKADAAFVCYSSLPDATLITLIRKDKISHFRVDLPASQLKKLIVDDFVVGYVHEGFKMGGVEKPCGNKKYFDKAAAILKDLYGYLVKPMEKDLTGIRRLYISADGYFSQIPFNILVCDEKDGIPEFLIEKYELSYLRPSFIENFFAAKSQGKIKKILAVANPRNENFPMTLLEGSIDEIGTANRLLKHDAPNDRDMALEHYAGSNPYNPVDVSAHLKELFRAIRKLPGSGPPSNGSGTD